MRHDTVEELGADPASSVIRKDADDHRRPLGRLGGPAEAEPDDLVAVERDEVEALRLPFQPPLHVVKLGRLARCDRRPDLAPGCEVGVRLRAADHPDLFSFPCRFAYCSPIRKTSRPSGIETAPIRTSGQSSSPIAVTPSPRRMASRR